MERRLIAISFLASLVLFGVAGFAGYGMLQSAWLAENAAAAPGAGTGDYPSTFLGILLRNAGACLLVYSGVVSCGITAVAALSAVGLYVGATTRLGTAAVGANTLLHQVGSYAPIEFLAVVVAGAAAFLPAIAMARNAARPQEHRTRAHSAYAAALPASLRVLTGSLLLVALAAAVESFQIAMR